MKANNHTFKEICIVHYIVAVDIEHLGVSIRLVWDSSPFRRDVEGVTVASSIGMVLVHPIVIAPKEVGIENKRCSILIFTYPIKHSIETTFANTCWNLKM